MKADYWVVVDIGCIECGEESHIVAVCKTYDEADCAYEDYGRGEGYFSGGQHHVEILPFPRDATREGGDEA